MSMVCKLSYVNPSLQPLLTFQPWCKLCSEYRTTKLPPAGGVANDDHTDGGTGRGRVWTIDVFEELVKKHANEHPDTNDDVS